MEVSVKNYKKLIFGYHRILIVSYLESLMFAVKIHFTGIK